MPPAVFPITINDMQLCSITLACTMMLADILVGFIVAVIKGEVSSVKMRVGLLHKVLLLVLIVVCLAIEVAIGHAVPLPYDIPTCEVVCAYIVIMELSSVLENIANGYPEVTDTALFKLFKLDDKKEETNDDEGH